MGILQSIEDFSKQQQQHRREKMSKRIVRMVVVKGKCFQIAANGPCVKKTYFYYNQTTTERFFLRFAGINREQK